MAGRPVAGRKRAARGDREDRGRLCGSGRGRPANGGHGLLSEAAAKPCAAQRRRRHHRPWRRHRDREHLLRLRRAPRVGADGHRRDDADAGTRRRHEDAGRAAQARSTRHACPRQECRLHRSRREPAPEHRQHEENLTGLSARPGGRSRGAASRLASLTRPLGAARTSEVESRLSGDGLAQRVHVLAALGETPVPATAGVLPTLIRWYLRSGLRGSTRCAFAFARHLKTLHAVPIVVNQRHQLWIDLRDGMSHSLLAGSPWATVPWESDEQSLMRRLVRPGNVVFDIGAHIGLHTVLLSEIVGSTGHVHAFEPNAGKAAALERTVAALPNAHLHAFALGESAGRVALYIPEDESMTSLADWTYGREWHRRRTTCEVRRLDDLVSRGELPVPDFVKCDVEGAELAVFHGAGALLDRADAPI